MNPADVPIPERLKRFPLWRGKYVIHYTVYTAKDGSPDFKVVNEAHRREALAKNLCHLCGTRLESPVVFVGGPKCEVNRVFMDGPMHEDCARYATKVCPYLALADSDHSKAPVRVEADHRVVYSQAVDIGRPARMALFFTNSYQTIRTPEGILIKAGPWVQVDWTAMPERVEPRAGPDAMRDAPAGGQNAWPSGSESGEISIPEGLLLPETGNAVGYASAKAVQMMLEQPPAAPLAPYGVSRELLGEPSPANYTAAVLQCPFHGKKP